MRKERTDLLDTVKLVILIFHCYGHKMACQVLYNSRWTPGLGLTDGECLERLWAYLGKFKSISKEMTPENHVDLLVDGLMHYGDKRKHGKTFAVRLKKAEALKVNTTRMLQETRKYFSQSSLGVVDPLVKEDIRKKISGWTSCCIKTWETAKKVNTAVQHHIKVYNLLEGSKMPYPEKLDLDSLKSLEVLAAVPEELKRLLIDLYETKERCDEEIELIACSMRSTNCFYMKQQEAVLTSFERAESDVHRAVLLLEGLNIERCILHLRNMSSNVSIVNEVPLHFHKKLQLDFEQEISSILGSLVSDEYLLEQLDVEESESMDSYSSSDEADDIEMDIEIPSPILA